MELGKFTNPARNDLIAMYKMAVNGKPDREIAEAFPASYTRYHKGIAKVRSLYLARREEPPEVVLLYGPPGTGKTSAVMYGTEELWKSPIGGYGWFDGYDEHQDVLLDEFSGRMSKCPLAELLALIDRYAQRVPIKGGFTRWAPRRIFLTTNYHPKDWYDWSDRSQQWFALVRRFDHVVVFKTEYGEPTVLHRGAGSTPPTWNYQWRKWWGHPTLSIELKDRDDTEPKQQKVRRRTVFDINKLSRGKKKEVLKTQRMLKKYLKK